MTQNEFNKEMDTVFASIFGDVIGTKDYSNKKEEKEMTGLNKVELMVEKEELLSKIRVYNIKAEAMGLEKIQVGTNNASEATPTEKIRDMINGRKFAYQSDARRFLMEADFRPVGNSTTIYQKENCVVYLEMKDLECVLRAR